MLTLPMPACLMASITVAKAPNGTSSSERKKIDWCCGSRILCFRRAPIWLMLMGSLPRNTLCDLSMLITSRSSVISLTVRVWGTLTSIPDCSIGAVTMKIMSSTSTTSTRGVMLMSESAVWVRPPLNQVKHLQGEVVVARGHFTNGANDEVVGDNRWDGGSQAGGGGNQSFGDAGSDRAQSRRASGAQPVECVDDSPDGSKQSNERRNGARNRQPRDVAFEARDLL